MRLIVQIAMGILFTTAQLAGQWNIDGIPVTSASGEQDTPAILSGHSGSIVVWTDYRGGSGDIYTQQVSTTGYTKWTTNGISVCAASGDQLYPVVSVDGSGGAIIAWEDYRSTASSGDIYVQRINSSGQPQWTANGVAVCNAQNVQMKPTVVGDGQGGAYIAWEDYRTSTGDIYVQHVSSNGTISWTNNGVPAAAVAGARYTPVISTAPGGGALVAWEENRTGFEYDIYAQNISASGGRSWGNGGKAVCTTSGYQGQLSGQADGSSLLLVWQDFRNGAADLYAEVLTGSGPILQSHGKPICTASGIQDSPGIVSDGQGGFIVAWTDYRSTSGDVYAQRIDYRGVRQWAVDGVPLCSVAGSQAATGLVTNGSDGAVVSWVDYRSPDGDVYVQRIDNNGQTQWQNNGVPVSTQNNTQQAPVVASDFSGGAVVAWTDYRNQSGDIYAQRVNQNGSAMPLQLVSFTGRRQGGGVHLHWRTASETNLHGFNVQSAHNEDEPFHTDGFVAATSSNGAEYEFIIPNTTASVFRLRAVDMDGTEHFSPALKVTGAAPSSFAIIDYYPVPVKDKLGIEITSRAGLSLRIQVLDILGNSAYESLRGITRGGRELHFIPAAKLPSGMYMVKIRAGVETRVLKFPVIR